MNKNIQFISDKNDFMTFDDELNVNNENYYNNITSDKNRDKISNIDIKNHLNFYNNNISTISPIQRNVEQNKIRLNENYNINQNNSIYFNSSNENVFDRLYPQSNRNITSFNNQNKSQISNSKSPISKNILTEINEHRSTKQNNSQYRVSSAQKIGDKSKLKKNINYKLEDFLPKGNNSFVINKDKIYIDENGNETCINIVLKLFII